VPKLLKMLGDGSCKVTGPARLAARPPYRSGWQLRRPPVTLQTRYLKIKKCSKIAQSVYNWDKTWWTDFLVWCI